MKKTMEKNLNRWKARICDYLNQSSKNLSTKKWKAYLVFFVLSGTALSMQIGVHALQHTKPLEGFSRPQSALLYKPGSLSDFGVKRFSTLLSRVKTYQAYLDSLSLRDSTKYRALLKSKPFLPDSLRALETLLVKNLKK
jgi:hypothetical protein